MPLFNIQGFLVLIPANLDGIFYLHFGIIAYILCNLSADNLLQRRFRPTIIKSKCSKEKSNLFTILTLIR